MNRKKIKKMGSRIIAFQVAAVLLVTTAFVGIPAKKAEGRRGENPDGGERIQCHRV